MKNKYKLLTLLFILVSSILISAYLFVPSHFQSLDNRVRDFYFKFRGNEEASRDIIIIDIDEKSIAKLGQWPWERDKFALILQNLTDNGAGIIGLDIVFAEADKTSPDGFAKRWSIQNREFPNYDKILAKTISQTPTILGYVFDFDHSNDNIAPNIPAIFIQKHRDGDYLPQALGVLANLDILQKAGYSSGYMNNIPDEAGIIRSIPILIEYQEMIFPSLALEMYRIAVNSKKVTLSYSEAGLEDIALGENHIATDRNGRMYLNFRGPSNSYRYISAIDIYNNSIKREEIEGKFIFIGTSAYGLMDLRSTPMDNIIAGVELHANLVDNLLNGDMLRKPSWSELADISIILIILAIIIFGFSRFSFTIIIALAILSLLSVLSFYYYLLFSQFLILNTLFPLVTLFFGLLTIFGVNYMVEFRQKEIIKRSFSKKVSKQVMEDLITHSDGIALVPKEVVATIYFSDIRDFTSISERLKSPKRITDFLNYYMDIMAESIESSSGTIDKFIGDSIMAYWNAPLKVVNHADKALHVAIKQIEQRDFMNKTIEKNFGFDIDYGIGINTGLTVVGEVGSKGRSDYTIIGDSVNLASRLEGLCKAYRVRLIISEFTKIELVDDYTIQLLDIVRVKGKREPIKIYEVISETLPTKEKAKELDRYMIAHKLYLESHFIKAKWIFEELYSQHTKYLYKLYIDRCTRLIQNNTQNFDGVFNSRRK